MTRVTIDDMTTLTLMDNDNHDADNDAAVAVMVSNGMECATKPGHVKQCYRHARQESAGSMPGAAADRCHLDVHHTPPCLPT